MAYAEHFEGQAVSYDNPDAMQEFLIPPGWKFPQRERRHPLEITPKALRMWRDADCGIVPAFGHPGPPIWLDSGTIGAGERDDTWRNFSVNSDALYNNPDDTFVYPCPVWVPPWAKYMVLRLSLSSTQWNWFDIKIILGTESFGTGTFTNEESNWHDFWLPGQKSDGNRFGTAGFDVSALRGTVANLSFQWKVDGGSVTYIYLRNEYRIWALDTWNIFDGFGVFWVPDNDGPTRWKYED